MSKVLGKKFSLLTLLILFSLFINGCASFTLSAKDFDKLYNLQQSSAIYDKNGRFLTQISGSERRTYVKIDELPPYVPQAFVAIEDARFYQHFGIDILGILRAFVVNILKQDLAQGASTITQQLVRNVYLTQEKTFARKIKEALLAIQLERVYTKKEILEMYLNVIYFGNGNYGIEEAAQNYFGKPASKLTLGEAAMLAGIPRRPNYYAPTINYDAAVSRKNLVLDKMVEQGYLTQEEAEKAKKEEIKINPKAQNQGNQYAAVIDKILQESEEDFGLSREQLNTGGYKIYTTIDREIQRYAEKVFANAQNFPPNTDEILVQGAAAGVDPETGGIVFLIGGRNYGRFGGFNRSFMMYRQPGSAFKPIVDYAPAFEKGYLPSDFIVDEPVVFGDYKPKNYDGTYHGRVTLRKALVESLNVPAVKLLNEIGVDTGYEYAQRFGFELTAKDKNLSLALGGLERGASPLQMAAAYAVFANGGIYRTPHIITKIIDKDGNEIPRKNALEEKRVISEETAYLITDVLVDTVKKGTARRANFGGVLAAKTGTTEVPFKTPGQKGTKDAWIVGYTPDISVAVWMGYDKTDRFHYLRGVTGGSYPAVILRKIVSYFVQLHGEKPFTIPGNLVRVSIDEKTGLIAGPLTPSGQVVDEVFPKGKEPKSISPETPPNPATQNSNLTAVYVEGKGVVLSWQPKPGYTYQIYRINEDSSTFMVGESSTGSFADTQVTPGSHYQYYLLPIQKRKDGGMKMELPTSPVAIDIPVSITSEVY
ncbi:transglycosylase domain-containing protein [Carboxydothermus ferrireducens]|uniref:Penicillin-binding protein 1A n=1 Tax=Carboxydothermus ferrireducens DSM 11255 TaxID=1119529 RepID=A0ABX2REE4_9THEO|nr:PBP1A family penicillin-binding protein [Carboxydothermus ferrireducens]NYE58393.1 1A family penicillin-binding protein [Carboxydothermus ferrireducens DSM 11255]